MATASISKNKACVDCDEINRGLAECTYVHMLLTQDEMSHH